ncbi:NmrA family NAD(P)-binding protein [Persicobacter diffluens]|uniref:NAD(P)-dependent oxidoreductase n=1 Tax=Persicobacter diffluens TaxID=981 RepID=A0AAN5APX8_9BACT|nr:NAD(P)-dependent oxidoreductase [Persicobacter diffluens]
MSNILVTGATGNIGFEVIRHLMKIKGDDTIIAGVRNIGQAKAKFEVFPSLRFTHFDFEQQDTFDKALENIDRIFLLRPPHISDIKTYYKPLIDKIASKGIREVCFLSVQGAERSKAIPHHKIEQLLIESKLDYIFLRPSYFMQNLTTVLRRDIQNKGEIVLPAGNAVFNWVDVENIGEVAALLLTNFEDYSGQAIELTGNENESFQTVAALISQFGGKEVRFKNVNPFRFYQIKSRAGMESGMILVMILLHFLPRFQKPPRISGFYKKITGKNPTNLETFIKRESSLFCGNN